MSALASLPLDQLQEIMPLLTPDETIYALRLVKQIEALAPAAAPEDVKPADALEVVQMEANLSDFFKQAWRVLEPGHELLWSWHYELLCEYLTLVAQKKLKRLIINVPPRTAKSNLVTKIFPVWMWLSDPTVAFLFASYSNSLSTDHSVNRRNLITSNWHQSLWSEKYQLSSDRNLTTQFSNDRTGQMIATSTGSGAEGKGCDIAILDDPMSSEQALSDAERTTSNRWVQNTLKQRLNNPATAAIILIMQRLHELDTTGFVEQEDPGVWTKLEIPLVAEKDERWEFPISGRVVERKRGEVLQPDRFTPAVVQEKQRSRLVYAGQYQQHPVPLEGNLIKRSEVKYYGGKNPVTGEPDAQLPEKYDLKLVSVDCAFKDLKTSDYVAVMTVGVKGSRRYVLNLVNEHLDFDGTETEIRRQAEAQRVDGSYVSGILVEDKANGSAVISRLKRNLSGVVAIEPQGGKIARFIAACPEWQAGDWYVDRTAAWSEPFVQQLTTFPLVAHDDMCDAMSQAAIWLGGNAQALGLVDFYKSGMAEAQIKALQALQKQGAVATQQSAQKAEHKNGNHSPACPECGNANIQRIGGQCRCQQCGKQFGELEFKLPTPVNRQDHLDGVRR